MKRNRNAFSNQQKASLRTHHHRNPHLTNLGLQRWFQDSFGSPINLSSVSRILSPRSAYLDDLSTHQLDDRRRRTEQWPELENALFEWVKLAEDQVIISQVLREKARQYWLAIYPDKDLPNFSNGWLRGFQIRRNIREVDTWRSILREAKYDFGVPELFRDIRPGLKARHVR